jgi:pyruvate,water dikinase
LTTQQVIRIQHTRRAACPDLILKYERIGREMAEAVGEKNANLGEVRNRLGLRVPRGFAITTAAFDRFMVFNQLGNVVQKLKAQADVIETETILQVSEQIQMLISESEVPPDLAQAILDAYGELDAATPAGQGPLKVSLRSSAIGEDSVLSFAGQYLSVLNVPPQGY